MFTITDAQFQSWLTMFMWPLVRVMAWFATDPWLSIGGVPRSIKTGFAVVLTIAIVPVLPPMPVVEVVSPMGIMILLQQVLIGLSLGYVTKLVFVAIELAGHTAGLQMGLGFASFYDPQHGATTAVMSQLYSLLTMLLFLVMDGHLLVLHTLIKSFSALPVAAAPFHGAGFKALVDAAGLVFHYGVILSLPTVAAVLITNLSIGVMSRAAPQLNVFAIGMPLTLGIGLGAMYFSLPAMAGLVHMLIEWAAKRGPEIAKVLAHG
ncbi:flagellar biosynthetic protein FliR [Burkholderiaceae bacterium DAT-1]|nr:flagellar biosynthetic protein FliR [Burkholderiaceae bacterium DAT-1]